MERLSASVRPIVTLILGFGFVGGAGYLVFEAVRIGDLDAAKDIFKDYSMPFLAVLGYYFGDRSARKAVALAQKEPPNA